VGFSFLPHIANYFSTHVAVSLENARFFPRDATDFWWLALKSSCSTSITLSVFMLFSADTMNIFHQ